jgi:hypothetical protein
VNDVLPAKQIVDEMVAGAKRAIEGGFSDLQSRARL